MKLAQRKQRFVMWMWKSTSFSGTAPQASFKHLPLFSALAPVAKATLPEVLGFCWSTEDGLVGGFLGGPTGLELMNLWENGNHVAGFHSKTSVV